MQNPVLPIAVNAANDMIRYAAEFGLTPAARARVGGGIVWQAMSGKFDGLLRLTYGVREERSAWGQPGS